MSVSLVSIGNFGKKERFHNPAIQGHRSPLQALEELAVLKCRWLAVTLMLVIAAPAFGQEVDIKWKFEKGKTFYQEMTTESKQTMKVMGIEINQTQKQTFFFSWTPDSQDEKDGSWRIKQKIEGVQMDLQISGTQITYDSFKEATAANNPLADFFKALIGAEFVLTLGKDMKVTKVEGKDEFLKKLTNVNQQMEPLLKQILSEEALKQMSDPTFAMIPDKPVKAGDTWKRTSRLNMGPIGTYESNMTYTFEGLDEKDKNLAKIKVVTDLKYVAPTGPAGAAALPFKIVNADLKTKDATGTILFDVEKGRLQSSDAALTLEGKLNIDVSGMTSEVELNQKQTTKVKTLDSLPKGDKPAEAPK